MKQFIISRWGRMVSQFFVAVPREVNSRSHFFHLEVPFNGIVTDLEFL